MRGMADDGAEEANVLVDDVSDMAGRAHTRGLMLRSQTRISAC